MKKKAAGSREGLSGLVKLIYNPIALCFHPHKSTHNRTSPLATEIQKMGYCRDLPHRVRHIPHRLRGGALLNKLKLKGQAAFGAFPVQGLTGAGLPTALHEKSPAQSAELQFVCGERGIRTPGPVKINGFQDRRIRPLCHLSNVEFYFARSGFL